MMRASSFSENKQRLCDVGKNRHRSTGVFRPVGATVRVTSVPYWAKLLIPRERPQLAQANRLVRTPRREVGRQEAVQGRTMVGAYG